MAIHSGHLLPWTGALELDSSAERVFVPLTLIHAISPADRVKNGSLQFLGTCREQCGTGKGYLSKVISYGDMVTLNMPWMV